MTRGLFFYISYCYDVRPDFFFKEDPEKSLKNLLIIERNFQLS